MMNEFNQFLFACATRNVLIYDRILSLILKLVCFGYVKIFYHIIFINSCFSVNIFVFF